MPRISPRQQRAWNIAIIVVLLVGAYFLRHYEAVILVSIIAAFIFNPVYRRIHRHFKRPGISASLTFIVSLIIIIIPLLIIGLIAVVQIKQLLNLLSEHPTIDIGAAGQSVLLSINNFLVHLPGSPQLTTADVNTWLTHFLSTVASNVLNIITSSIGSISRFITTIIIYIYLFVNVLMHQDELLGIVKRLNPLGDSMSETYLRQMGLMTMAMGRGQFIIAFLQGTESAMVLYLVGFHNLFLFFMVFLSFLSLIPLGAGIVTIPMGIVMIALGDVWQGAILIANHLLIVTNIDNVVRPRLVPKNAHLNSALTILGVFAGVAMFGFFGIIIGPVLMILIVSTIQAYVSTYSADAQEK